MTEDAHNPYHPPRAETADPPEPLLPARPRKVTIALALIGAAVLSELLVVVRYAQLDGFRFIHARGLAWTVGTWALVGFSCYHIMRGRGWARFVLLSFTLLVFAVFCYNLGFFLRQPYAQLSMLLNAGFMARRVLPLALDMAALHLLFFSSGAWFKARAGGR